MADPHGPRPTATPPADAGPSLGSWTLTDAHELSVLRRSATAVLRPEPADEAARRLLLVLSELATNALKYGSQPVTVSLHSAAGGWLLDVRDGNWRTPPGHRARDDGRPGGYGLRILDTVTTAWGWYPGPDDGVKHVWAVVPAAGAPTAATGEPGV
ncbi:ATP-binding protein [Georgenia sp. Marseille-Q6866]